MTSYLIAIDNGSQSTKVSVVDERGRVHAFAQRPLRPYDTSGGRVVHPDDDLWDSITATCTEALARFTGDRSAIVAAGLCTIRFCRALLDADGLLVEPVISWMDARVGRPFDGRPGVRRITTSSGYITHRLTGRFRDTAGNYAGLWPIDPGTWRWSDDPAAYTASGMPAEMLVELVDPGGLLGEVTPAAAAATGLPAGLPVYATSNDKAVEALGSGVREPGTLLLSLGTYITSMAFDKRHDRPTEGGVWRNFGSVPGEFLYESDGIRRGMWTVSWFRDLLGDTTEEELSTGAAEVLPGANGLVTVLDWLAPADAPHRRGALIGFDGSQGRYAIHRSILEGIACTMAGHADRLATVLDRPFDRLVVAGGGARSTLVLQILAGVFDLRTVRMTTTDGAGAGAAICAAVGSGVHTDWEAATAAMVHVSETVEPDPAEVAAYRRVRATHDVVTRHLGPMLREARCP